MLIIGVIVALIFMVWQADVRDKDEVRTYSRKLEISEREYRNKRSSIRQKRYSRNITKTQRKVVLERDNYKCVY